MLVAVIQARMGSTRLPGKMLAQIEHRSVLGWVIRSVVESEVADQVVVATTVQREDDALVEEAAALGARAIRGSPQDVLSRFLQVAEETGATALVRISGDCPLLDPSIIRTVAGAFQAGGLDYAGTVMPRTLPLGFDAEIASVQALERAGRLATGAHRAHVTSYLYSNTSEFRTAGITFLPDAHDLRVTLDTEEDLTLIRAIATTLGDRPPDWNDVVALLRENPQLVSLNQHVSQKPFEEG